MHSHNETGKRGEQMIANLAKLHGRTYEKAPYQCVFDCLIDGWSVEIKTSTRQRKDDADLWRFNIHRRGKINESETDFYVFRLEDVPGCKKKAVHLLFRAPLKCTVFNVTIRSLLNGYSSAAGDFKKFMDGEYGKPKHSWRIVMERIFTAQEESAKEKEEIQHTSTLNRFGGLCEELEKRSIPYEFIKGTSLRLMVNGKRVSYSPMRKSHFQGRDYTQLARPRNGDFEFQVGQSWEGFWFVFPKSKLPVSATMFSTDPALPGTDATRHDFLNYRDAWHLLAAPKESQ
jgi:hypothetical protein